MSYKIIIEVGKFPPRDCFSKFDKISPNNIKINFIDVNGVYINPHGDFIYLSDLEVDDYMIPYNIIGFDRYHNLMDYTISSRRISRYETSGGHKLYLMEEE